MNDATPLVPDVETMTAFIQHLFGGWLYGYESGLVELAWTPAEQPPEGVKQPLPFARLFGTDELDELVEMAAKRNTAPYCNMYIGAALRHPDTPRNKRTSDADAWSLTAPYGDLDKEDAVKNALAVYGDNKPTLITLTGQYPHKRIQPWWRLTEPLTDHDVWEAQLHGICSALHGDSTVTNPGRLMRLAGSVAWPVKPDRIAELTSIVPLKKPGLREYEPEHIARIFPPARLNGAARPDPATTTRATSSLGFGGKIDDGRDAYQRDTAMAVFIELTGTTGAVPTEQELFDAAWPQYERNADLTRPGHGPDEMRQKCRYLLQRFQRGEIPGLRTLDEVVEAYRKKRADDDEEEESAPAPRGYPRRTIAEVHEVFTRWLGKDYDLDTLDAALAAAAAEKLSGDPPWLLIISGPGNAKTETVQALSGAGAHITSTISSEGALLSATARKERDRQATGGLLRKIGKRGVLVIKDVTSILSANHNTRAGVLAALREVYDGRWERNVGTDGGRTLTWTGRIVVVGAVTTAWDTAHSVIAVMGDRFVTIRSDSSTGRTRSGLNAIRNTGNEVAMREELAEAVGSIIEHASLDEYQLSDAENEQLVAAADIVTMARTAVERDYQGEVINAHAPEMPTRFAKQLVQMIRGAVAIGMTPAAGMRLAIRCARDSIPPLRSEILLDVAAHPASRPADVRKRLGRPWRTVKREMEALHMLRLLECDEEEERSRDGESRTIWLYSLDPDLDEDTLLAMQRYTKPGE